MATRTARIPIFMLWTDDCDLDEVGIIVLNEGMTEAEQAAAIWESSLLGDENDPPPTTFDELSDRFAKYPGAHYTDESRDVQVQV